MAPPGGSDLRFTIYGLEHHGHEVDASVFADKLKKLVSGLKAMDSFYNISGQHKFMIHNLEFASATVILREKVVKQRTVRVSPAARLANVGAAASGSGSFIIENQADEVALKTYQSLATGAGNTFSYGVIAAEQITPVRLDSLLESRVKRIISAAVDVAQQAQARFFKGIALETYDGEMKLVDIRGLFPEAKLILSAGKKEVSCVVPRSQVDDLRLALGRRALVTGRAHHDGRSMIPERIDVTSIKIIDDSAPNVISLKGKFPSFPTSNIQEVG
jgi:hypothetical protein